MSFISVYTYVPKLLFRSTNILYSITKVTKISSREQNNDQKVKLGILALFTMY